MFFQPCFILRSSSRFTSLYYSSPQTAKRNLLGHLNMEVDYFYPNAVMDINGLLFDIKKGLEMIEAWCLNHSHDQILWIVGRLEKCWGNRDAAPLWLFILSLLHIQLHASVYYRIHWGECTSVLAPDSSRREKWAIYSLHSTNTTLLQGCPLYDTQSIEQASAIKTIRR